MKHAIIVALLFTFKPLCAQEAVVAMLSQQLEESRISNPAMRPQVFFSQDKYAPGDTAFFRLFILTETEKILAERSLLTLELIHPNGKPCAREVVSCQRFGAANQLVLPDTLSAGQYEVRLFSDRMTKAYGLTSILHVVREKQLVLKSRRGEQITFFPEGGHLVTGALNRVVMRASGAIPASAVLLSDEGRIMQVDFNHSDLTEVQFVPQRDHTYRLEYVIGNQTLQAPLPPTEPEAVALRIYRGPKQTFVLDLSTGPKGPRSATLLLVATRQILHSKEVKFKSDRANILTAPGYFPEGFSEVFIVDEDGHVLAYRPMYIAPTPAASVAISGISQSVTLREEIMAELKLTDAEGHPVVAGLAIAVIPDEARTQAIRTPDPTLELRPEPSGFDWTQPALRVDQEIIAKPPPRTLIPDFPPLIHRSNLSLTGRAYTRDATRTLPYLSRIVIYLHNDLIQYETSIGSSGNFEFEKIYDFLGSDRVFHKVIHLGKTIPNTAIDWSVDLHEAVQSSGNPFAEGAQEDAYGTLRKRKQIIDRSFSYFLKKDTGSLKVTNYNATLERQFREPDLIINPGEYVPFETMRELILEVVPSVKFRVHGGDSIVEIDLRTNSPMIQMRYPEDIPLYVIDGYMTTNTSYLMNLSPQDIVSIKIIQDIDKLNRLENLAPDGVLFIQTRLPERTRRDLEKDLHVIDGLSPTLQMATRYPTQPRVPDLRSMLYWSPLIDTDTTGTAKFAFRTSDIPGAYWVRVMGTTTTGHLVAAEQRFVVSHK